MGDIQKAHDYLEAKEATERLRGQHKVTPLAVGFLVLVSAGTVMAVIRTLFDDIPWRELIWRLPLGAAVIWLPCALLVFLFGAGKIKAKTALALGAIPSLIALIPFILILIPPILVLVGLTVIVSDWAGMISRRLKRGSR